VEDVPDRDLAQMLKSNLLFPGCAAMSRHDWACLVVCRVMSKRHRCPL